MPETKNHPIKAITIDLDDTLWPIWPAIDRAEVHLHGWLQENAPLTAAATSPQILRTLRNQVEQMNPQWKHDLSAYRREAIRLALAQQGENELLAEEAFNVFFEMRQHVDFFDDALPALKRLSSHLPVIAISNGNADLNRMGIGHYFKASISAQNFGVSKPDPRIFHEAIKHIQPPIRPEEILHVGDDYQLDVVGALNAGFQAAWVVHPEITCPPDSSNISNRQGQEEYKPHYQVNNLLVLCEALGL